MHQGSPHSQSLSASGTAFPFCNYRLISDWLSKLVLSIFSDGQHSKEVTFFHRHRVLAAAGHCLAHMWDSKEGCTVWPQTNQATPAAPISAGQLS